MKDSKVMDENLAINKRNKDWRERMNLLESFFSSHKSLSFLLLLGVLILCFPLGIIVQSTEELVLRIADLTNGIFLLVGLFLILSILKTDQIDPDAPSFFEPRDKNDLPLWILNTKLTNPYIMVLFVFTINLVTIPLNILTGVPEPIDILFRVFVVYPILVCIFTRWINSFLKSFEDNMIKLKDKVELKEYKEIKAKIQNQLFFPWDRLMIGGWCVLFLPFSFFVSTNYEQLFKVQGYFKFPFSIYAAFISGLMAWVLIPILASLFFALLIYIYSLNLLANSKTIKLNTYEEDDIMGLGEFTSPIIAVTMRLMLLTFLGSLMVLYNTVTTQSDNLIGSVLWFLFLFMVNSAIILVLIGSLYGGHNLLSEMKNQRKREYLKIMTDLEQMILHDFNPKKDLEKLQALAETNLILESIKKRPEWPIPLQQSLKIALMALSPIVSFVISFALENFFVLP